MSPEQEIATIDNAVLFMKRTNLQGGEVIAFNQVMSYLIERRQAAESASTNAQQSLDLTAQGEMKGD